LLNAAIVALSGYINRVLPGFSKVLLLLFEIIFSYGLTTVLFAFIYRFMADIKIKWRYVWTGAVFTSFLFAVGKYLIGIYLGRSNIATTYGAASSIIMILLWVYYSSQIVFFGAEFTRALATRHGEKLDTRPEKQQLKAA
jgi:membrane protein